MLVKCLLKCGVAIQAYTRGANFHLEMKRSESLNSLYLFIPLEEIIPLSFFRHHRYGSLILVEFDVG